MGAGNRKASQQRQEGLSRTQEEMGRFFMDQSKQDLAQRRQLQAPVIDYYTQLASGDPSKLMTASAVPLGNLSRATQQARANIMEMAPGAARTAALGQLGREASGQQAALLNQQYLSAFPALQGLAAESGSAGLSSAGAGYRGVEGAASTNQQIMQIQQQQKASQLGLLGSMAGLAGGLVTGGLMGGKGGAAGAAKTWSPSSMVQPLLYNAPQLVAASSGASSPFSSSSLGPSASQFFNAPGAPVSGVPIQSAGSNLFSGYPSTQFGYSGPIPGSPAGYGSSVRP